MAFYSTTAISLFFLLLHTLFVSSQSSCTNNATATSNKCSGVNCVSSVECRSQLCNIASMVCSTCVADDTTFTTTRCEGYLCSNGSECLLKSCLNNICAFVPTPSQPDITESGSIIWVVIIALVVICLVVIGICCFLSIKRKKLEISLAQGDKSQGLVYEQPSIKKNQSNNY